jgi:hypothetical protein
MTTELMWEWDGECSSCGVTYELDEGCEPPDVKADALCHACVWNELEAQRTLTVTLESHLAQERTKVKELEAQLGQAATQRPASEAKTVWGSNTPRSRGCSAHRGRPMRRPGQLAHGTGTRTVEVFMSTSRFAVTGALDGAGGVQDGTVLIDRVAKTFGVRVYNKRRIYMLPLSVVADMVVKSIIMAEHRAAHPPKPGRKVARRRA